MIIKYRELKRLIRESVREELMNLNGRRESGNVEDRRFEPRLNKITALAYAYTEQLVGLNIYNREIGQKYEEMVYGPDGIAKQLLANCANAYNTVVKRIAQKGNLMVKLNQRLNATAAPVNEQNYGETEWEMKNKTDAERVYMKLKLYMVSAGDEFLAMLKEYEAGVENGKIAPNIAVRDLQSAYGQIYSMLSDDNRKNAFRRGASAVFQR